VPLLRRPVKCAQHHPTYSENSWSLASLHDTCQRVIDQVCTFQMQSPIHCSLLRDTALHGSAQRQTLYLARNQNTTQLCSDHALRDLTRDWRLCVDASGPYRVASGIREDQRPHTHVRLIHRRLTRLHISVSVMSVCMLDKSAFQVSFGVRGGHTCTSPTVKLARSRMRSPAGARRFD
jgi:hypothetical protein